MLRTKLSWFRALGLVTAIGLLASCDSDELVPPDIQDQFGAVTGQILIEGVGAVGLNVSLSTDPARITESGADGSFAYADVPIGTYTVTVSGEDDEVSLVAQSMPVTVVGRQTATVSFTGEILRTASIQGRVILDGAGDVGRTVDLSGVEVRSAVTDASGGYSFDSLRKGAYTIELGGIDNTVRFESTSAQFNLGVGDQETADFSGIREVFATGRIVAVEDADTGARLSLSQLKGNLEVLVTADGGTRTLTALRVLMLGTVVGELDLTGAAAASASGEDFRIPFNSAQFDPVTGAPIVANGAGDLSLELETLEDGAVEVDSEAITITNVDQIGGFEFVTALTDPGVISQGNAWYGNQDLSFKATPVIYSGVTIGSIEVEALSDPSANATGPLDFGSGPGMPHIVAGPDFTFTATAALNAGVVENDPGGIGSTIQIRRVFDGEGVDITSSVDNSAKLTGLFFDYVGPIPGAAAGVTLDDGPVLGGEWYSEGEFTFRDVGELGVGGLAVTIDAVVGAATIVADATNLDDLPERLPEYRLKLSSLADQLGNVGDVAGISQTQPFGVDRTGMTMTGIRPLTSLIVNPLDDALDGVEDNQIPITINDPVLTDNSAGSGYGNVDVEATGGLGGVFSISGKLAPAAPGANLLDLLGGLPEDSYHLVFTASDKARPANVTTASVDFVLDNTAPVVVWTAGPSPTINSGNSSVGITLAGGVTDENGLRLVRVVVRNGSSDGDNDCEETDALMVSGSGPGQVNSVIVDITETAAAHSNIFSINRLPGQVQLVCFMVEADDNAQDVNGGNEPNRTVAIFPTTITWS